MTAFDTGELLGGVSRESGVAVAMRDGTILRADVYRPSGDHGPLPVLLQRTPYARELAQTIVYRHPAWYARHGYVVAIVDVRGRGASDGDFDPLRNEAADGFDSVEWAGSLDGTTGRVGTYGFSYAGAVQLLAGVERPPSLACAIPGFTAWDFFSNWAYANGAFSLAFVVSWALEFLAVPDALHSGREDVARELVATLARDGIDSIYRDRPLRDSVALREGIAPYLADWLEHDTYDDYWRAIEIQSRLDRIEVPCLHVGGWYDSFLEGTVRLFARLDELSGGDPARAQHVVVGPWLHIPWSRHVGARDFGTGADNAVDALQLRWFDRWLKDDEQAWPADEPRVRYFAMGEDEWRTAESWPPPGTSPHELHLRSDGDAQSLSGAGRLSAEPPAADEPPDIFVYVPADPVPSLGGRSCCTPDSAPMGAFDHRVVETRNDVLVYTTAPLDEPLEVCGAVEIVLYAASDAVDTDWTAKLLDVSAYGRAVNLCDGIVRARYRDSLEQPRPLQPGAVVEYRFVVGSIANVFAAGHRVRLEISSSNFPMYDVNPNTGTRSIDADPLRSVSATQAVLHTAARPSRLILPRRQA